MTAVLVSSPAAYGLLKIVSIAWLLWLGSQLILSGCKAHNTESASAVAVTLQGAWLANVLNPKAIMFYLTVVTQFAGSDGGMAHYLLLASVHIMVMTVWLVGISYALVFSARKANSLMLKIRQYCWRNNADFLFSVQPVSLTFISLHPAGLNLTSSRSLNS